MKQTEAQTRQTSDGVESAINVDQRATRAGGKLRVEAPETLFQASGTPPLCAVMAERMKVF